MLEYFKDLTEEELVKFEKFVCSPYFNSQKNNVRMFEYLKGLHPDIKKDDISKKSLSINIYGEKDVNDVKIRKLISEFSLLMEKFYTQIEVDNESLRNKILLLQSLRKRGLQKRFEMNYNSTFKLLKKSFSKDESYYLNKINLVNEMFYFKFGDIRGEIEKGIQEKSDNLDYYFAFTKLHAFNEMIHNEGTKNKNSFFKKNYFDEIIRQVEENKGIIAKYHPNLLIIYYVVMMFETMDDKFLNKLTDYLKNKGSKFHTNNLKYYYHYITQYYIKKTNLGQIQYREKAFEFYKYMREKKLFIIDNIITDFEFNNVVNISLALKEYDWLDCFVEEYKKYLDPSFAKDAYNLAKAKLMFGRKDYKNIFQYLNNVDFKDANYYAHSKFLLGRVYFDMGNINEAKYIVDNLKQYLRTKKEITSEQAETIKIFYYYLNELVKIIESDSESKKSLKIIFTKELNNEKKLVPNKNWFYEKINAV